MNRTAFAAALLVAVLMAGAITRPSPLEMKPIEMTMAQ